MKYDEFKTQITDIMSNPETAPARMTVFLETMKAEFETNENLKQEYEKSQTKIKDLQDTNMKLFLAQTGQAEDKLPEEEKEGQEAIDDFISHIMADKE